MSHRLQAALGLSAIAAFGILTALPASASAAQSASAHQPAAAHVAAPAASFDHESCNGDVCMILDWDGSSANFNIFVGANSNAFVGYFHLSGPGGPFSPANTPTEAWSAHGLSRDDFYTWTVVGHPQDGRYCESAFQSGISIGKACVTYP